MTSCAYWSLGLMSGTSLDGIDAALIKSDGERVLEFGASLTVPYTDALRHELREVIYGRGDLGKAARDMTLAHVAAVQALLAKTDIKPDVIGFHGQSVDHRPKEGITLQIGDPALLAERTGIDVVADFRRRDVAAGGQGAPLVPLFHAALVADRAKPVAVLNIGGIANVTWVGDQSPVASRQSSETKHPTEQGEARSGGGSVAGGKSPLIIAMDTGPGNVLLNEWLGLHTGTHMDLDGKTASQGRVDESVLAMYLQDPFFAQKPPKSLDRNYFHIDPIRHLSLEDGAATLAAFTTQSIAKAQQWFPAPVAEWIVAGGGRHNPVLMEGLRSALEHPTEQGDARSGGQRSVGGKAPKIKILTAEQSGWDGDALEAQAFGFLAIRSLLGLPLSLPTTTGVSHAVTGGAFYQAAGGGR